MKRNIIIVALVIFFLVSVNCFARDDNNLQHIKNWTYYFTTEKGAKLFYEHEEGEPLAPVMHKFKDAIGYQYFYNKLELTQEQCEDLQKEREFINSKIGYQINWYRIDCRNEKVELIQAYFYSDANEYIISFDMRGKIPDVPLKGSRYEKIPFNKRWINEARQEAEINTILKKYNARSLVPISMLEVNPYEFEGHKIAVVVQFQKMLSKSSAIFFSGYTNLSDSTGVPDQIVVSGLPKGMHFKSGFMAPRMIIAIKGKGTIEGTNAYGARVKVPHFKYIGTLSGEQPSVFEEQRDNSRKDALRNAEQSRKSKNR